MVTLHLAVIQKWSFSGFGARYHGFDAFLTCSNYVKTDRQALHANHAAEVVRTHYNQLHCNVDLQLCRSGKDGRLQGAC